MSERSEFTFFPSESVSWRGKKTRLDFFDSFFHQGKNEWKADKEVSRSALRKTLAALKNAEGILELGSGLILPQPKQIIQVYYLLFANQWPT
jgi:hypothetical protein